MLVCDTVLGFLWSAKFDFFFSSLSSTGIQVEDINMETKRKPRLSSTSGDDLCPVCSETVEILAVGRCDHAICYRCSTRMRVLCEQMYCAICRTDLPKVWYIAGAITTSSSFLIFTHLCYLYADNWSVLGLTIILKSIISCVSEEIMHMLTCTSSICVYKCTNFCNFWLHNTRTNSRNVTTVQMKGNNHLTCSCYAGKW